ncbi:MAG: hypothetical protein EB127_19930 [Alphaproteobacteria bacterium]|nr:hypothetical protein [Alphaproteobacteria bacterium]
MTKEAATIALSGAFDPLHVGHIRMIKSAVNFGRVIIILNSDTWVKKRKGYLLTPWYDRKELLLSINGVSEVIKVDDSDETVCEALERVRPTIFGNGGYTTRANTPERELCLKLGIRLVWGLGGGEKDAYSNDMIGKILNKQVEEIELDWR